MRIRSWIKLLASEDTEETQCFFARDNEAKEVVIDDAQKEIQSGQIIIPVSTTDLQLNFGGVSTAAYLYLEGDNEFSFKINGPTASSTDIGLHTVSVGTPKARAFMTVAAATALFISNPSNQLEVTLKYAIIGI